MMNSLSREEKEELNKLSKDVLGASSRWRKMIENGYAEQIMRTVVEEVPGENGAPATTRTVQIPVLLENGVKQYRTQYHTVESVRTFMLELKDQRDQIMAQIQKQKDQQKLINEVNEKLGGSAV
jgi:hypothetical protein